MEVCDDEVAVGDVEVQRRAGQEDARVRVDDLVVRPVDAQGVGRDSGVAGGVVDERACRVRGDGVRGRRTFNSLLLEEAYEPTDRVDE